MKKPLFVLLVLALSRASNASAAPSYQAAYYFGNSTTFLPDGTSVGSSQALIKRKVYADQNLIIERLVVIVPKPGVKPQEFVTIGSVSGSAFDIVELGDAFVGKGELIGPAGNWTAWNSRSVMPDGGVLESHDRLTSDGLVVEKKYFDAAGKVSVVIKESFPAISESEYKDRYLKLFPPQSKP